MLAVVPMFTYVEIMLIKLDITDVINGGRFTVFRKANSPFFVLKCLYPEGPSAVSEGQDIPWLLKLPPEGF